jgi:hypothetical protein
MEVVSAGPGLGFGFGFWGETSRERSDLKLKNELQSSASTRVFSIPQWVVHDVVFTAKLG